MPKFCENCGANLSDTAKFCSSCGKAVGAGVASPPPVASKRSEPATKLILGAVALLVLLGGGAVLYFSHGTGKNAEQVTQGLPDVAAVANALQSAGLQAVQSAGQQATQGAEPQAPAVAATTARLDENKVVTAADGQCALFTKEELTRVLGTNFTHADADATGCTYKGDAPREFVRTEALWKGGRNLVKLKSDTYAGLHQSMVNQKYTKAEIDAHAFPIVPFPGAGDEAWVDLINIVTARKADVGITMDLRYYRDSEDLTKMFVNVALARLRANNPASAETPGHAVQ
jgi:zinc-ribbon domain